jgi:ferrous iron transport protein B
LTISCVILCTYFPCVATFVVLLRELGVMAMLKATGLMVAVSLAVGVVLRVILIGF